MLYFYFTPAVPLLIYVTAAIRFYFNIFIYTPALLAYWPRRVCGGKRGTEERWSMGAWRVAAEASW
jgi:hypothetical protein